MYKGNWSKAINIDDSDGVFCGREKELQQLQSFLINNNSGSILISGLRGVGKTTFIYKTIQNLKLYYGRQQLSSHNCLNLALGVFIPNVFLGRSLSNRATRVTCA
jgi:Cdc6-like AAA superfamily ATPase